VFGAPFVSDLEFSDPGGVMVELPVPLFESVLLDMSGVGLAAVAPAPGALDMLLPPAAGEFVSIVEEEAALFVSVDATGVEVDGEFVLGEVVSLVVSLARLQPETERVTAIAAARKRVEDDFIVISVFQVHLVYWQATVPTPLFGFLGTLE
jgi:hypothetical protein